MMIDLETAMAKLVELERRDGPERFVKRIYQFPMTFQEYYLHDEFGLEYGGGGDKLAHYRSRTDGRSYDLQYVQIAFSIVHQTNMGTVGGSLVAASVYTGWTDVCVIAEIIKGASGQETNWGGLSEFSQHGENYHGYNLGLAASTYETMADFVESGLMTFLTTYNGWTFDAGR